MLLGLQFFATITAEERVGAVFIVFHTLGNVVAVHQVTAGIALAVTIGIQALDGHIVAAGAVHIVGAVIVGGDTRTEQAAHLVTAGIAGVVTIVIIAFISDKVTAGAVHIVGTVIVGGDACLVCVILGLQFFATIIAEERVGTVPIVLSSLGSVVAVHQVTTGITFAVTIGVKALDFH